MSIKPQIPKDPGFCTLIYNGKETKLPILAG
jgi:hypothetical protein